MLNLIFKVVKKNDLGFLLKLRNNIEARKNSNNKRIIKIDEHKKWFKNFNKINSNKIFIIYKSKKKIAYVKYEFINEEFYRTSINIKKEFRNKNLSKKILVGSEKFLKKGIILFSEVKKNNFKSNKLFISANYNILNYKKGLNQYYKVIENVKDQNSVKIENIIKNIENVRKKNNLNWMNLLKLSYKENPKETKRLFSKIYYSDKKINSLSKKII